MLGLYPTLVADLIQFTRALNSVTNSFDLSLLDHSLEYFAHSTKLALIKAFYSGTAAVTLLLNLTKSGSDSDAIYKVEVAQFWMCVMNNTRVARTSRNKISMTWDLYCCLVPQCEGLRTCCSAFPTTTKWCFDQDVKMVPVRYNLQKKNVQ